MHIFFFEKGGGPLSPLESGFNKIYALPKPSAVPRIESHKPSLTLIFFSNSLILRGQLDDSIVKRRFIPT